MKALSKRESKGQDKGKSMYVIIIYDEKVDTLEEANALKEAIQEELLEESSGLICTVGEVQEDETIKTI
jgi:hypothetical protein